MNLRISIPKGKEWYQVIDTRSNGPPLKKEDRRQYDHERTSEKGSPCLHSKQALRPSRNGSVMMEKLQHGTVDAEQTPSQSGLWPISPKDFCVEIASVRRGPETSSKLVACWYCCKGDKHRV